MRYASLILPFPFLFVTSAFVYCLLHGTDILHFIPQLAGCHYGCLPTLGQLRLLSDFFALDSAKYCSRWSLVVRAGVSLELGQEFLQKNRS